MNLMPEVDCGECPKLCCYSLAREGVGFSHPTEKPSTCRHCDVVSEKGCKIHDILHPKSRNCDAYTCYGVGNRLVDIFGLDPNKKAPISVQKTFSQRQGIARYLWEIKIFLKEQTKNRKLATLREFVRKWESHILSSPETKDISIGDFVEELNTILRELRIGYDVRNCQFCFL